MNEVHLSKRVNVNFSQLQSILYPMVLFIPVKEGEGEREREREIVEEREKERVRDRNRERER